MIKGEYILLVFGMGLVTYLPRWIPLFFLSRRNLSGFFVEWLDLVPAATPAVSSARAMGCYSNLPFCPQNKIIRRYRHCGHDAFLDGWKDYVRILDLTKFRPR